MIEHDRQTTRRNAAPPPAPIDRWGIVSVHICDRCGDITVNTQTCSCASPYDQIDIRRRRDGVIDATRRHAVTDPGPGRRSGSAVSSGQRAERGEASAVGPSPVRLISPRVRSCDGAEGVDLEVTVEVPLAV
jgi:hypothetical protein